jgi:hypothetical protein
MMIFLSSGRDLNNYRNRSASMTSTPINWMAVAMKLTVFGDIGGGGPPGDWRDRNLELRVV